MRSILITLSLIALNIFSGTLIVLSFTETIFKQLDPSAFQAETSAVVVAAVQVVSVYVASTMVDKIGRRYLLAISCVGTAFCSLAMLGFVLIEKNPKTHVLYIMPLITMCTYLFMTSVGIVPISFIIIAEILPYEVGLPIGIQIHFVCIYKTLFINFKIREIGSTIAVMATNIFAFGAILVTPFIIKSWGLEWLFVIFTVVCLLGALFVFSCVTETKWKDLYT